MEKLNNDTHSESTTKCKECFRCRNFDAYYTRGVKRFDKTKYGWCSKLQESVNIHNTCSMYTKKLSNKKDKYIIGHYLNTMLSEIMEIHKVLIAVSEEENDL